MPRLTPTDILAAPQQAPRWLVQDFLYQQSLVILAGDPGVGKSILSYSLALSVASGQPFLCFPASQPRRVLYFDEENSLPDASQYLAWVWRGLGQPDLTTLDLNLRFEHFTISAYSGPWFACMLEAARDFRPHLIICDTASPITRCRDENDNGEATQAIQSLRRVQLAAACDTSLLVLKHTVRRHDPKIDLEHRYSVRGAKAWLGAPDGVIFHHARAGRPRLDGLRQTYLEPHKTRAWGLRSQVSIEAAWTCSDPASRGLKLAATLF